MTRYSKTMSESLAEVRKVTQEEIAEGKSDVANILGLLK